MSHLADEIARQMDTRGLDQVQVAERSGISQSQISKWLNSAQQSISEALLTSLAEALSDDPAEHAALVRAHLMDEKFGAGSELVRIDIDAPAPTPHSKARSKGERAMAFLAEERPRNPDLNELLIDLARVLGADLSSSTKAAVGAAALRLAKDGLKKRKKPSGSGVSHGV